MKIFLRWCLHIDVPDTPHIPQTATQTINPEGKRLFHKN